MRRYTSAIFLLSVLLASCTPTLNTSKTNQARLMINPAVNIDEPIPVSPIFNDAHQMYLNNMDSPWGIFAGIVYKQKFSLNKSTLKFLAKEGLSQERVNYLIEKEVWERVNCEVVYLQAFADDEELKNITEGILKDVQINGDYDVYWRAFSREEKVWISRDNLGNVQAKNGKEDVANRFSQIVEQLDKCIDKVAEPVIITYE